MYWNHIHHFWWEFPLEKYHQDDILQKITQVWMILKGLCKQNIDVDMNISLRCHQNMPFFWSSLRMNVKLVVMDVNEWRIANVRYYREHLYIWHCVGNWNYILARQNVSIIRRTCFRNIWRYVVSYHRSFVCCVCLYLSQLKVCYCHTFLGECLLVWTNI